MTSSRPGSARSYAPSERARLTNSLHRLPSTPSRSSDCRWRTSRIRCSGRCGAHRGCAAAAWRRAEPTRQLPSHRAANATVQVVTRRISERRHAMSIKLRSTCMCNTGARLNPPRLASEAHVRSFASKQRPPLCIPRKGNAKAVWQWNLRHRSLSLSWIDDATDMSITVTNIGY